ncbi:TorD/DmsD family molecular chaperone [Paenibacillus caui]|uniref:TorD/DmsD family molecular chaperone n=1 Tax=Paenibacillus caui TaxID=2873927 RepID=UPI001CA94B42|nr:molecular chaperone TorD family protein [Paenibacillus caui]
MSTLSEDAYKLTEQQNRWLMEREVVYQLLIDFLERSPELSLLARYRNIVKLRGSITAWEGGGELTNYFNSIQDHELRRIGMDEAEEYRRLFTGEDAKLAASESAVRARTEGVQTNAQTGQVGGFYSDCGVVFNKVNGERDDSLTMELEFMAVIADRMKCAGFLSCSRSSLVEMQIRFLENHLLRWAITFADELAAATRSQLYAALAAMLKQFLLWDLAMLYQWREGVRQS